VLGNINSYDGCKVKCQKFKNYDFDTTNDISTSHRVYASDIIRYAFFKSIPKGPILGKNHELGLGENYEKAIHPNFTFSSTHELCNG
jgi:hypothetical protein